MVVGRRVGGMGGSREGRAMGRHGRGDPWIGTRGAALLSPCLSLTAHKQEEWIDGGDGDRCREARVTTGSDWARGREARWDLGAGPGRGKWPEACWLDGLRLSWVLSLSLYSLLLTKREKKIDRRTKIEREGMDGIWAWE